MGEEDPVGNDRPRGLPSDDMPQVLIGFVLGVGFSLAAYWVMVGRKH